MALQDSLKTLYLCWLVQPKADRALFRQIRRLKPRAIVEIGLSNLVRTRRTIEMARKSLLGQEIRYAAIDLFDARPDHQPAIALKQTHQLVTSLGVTPRLIPGDVLSALARAANQLQNTDLLLINTPDLTEGLEHAWKFVPRMLSPHALVMQALPDGDLYKWQPRDRAEIEAQVHAATVSRKAAA